MVVICFVESRIVSHTECDCGHGGFMQRIVSRLRMALAIMALHYLLVITAVNPDIRIPVVDVAELLLLSWIPIMHIAYNPLYSLPSHS